MRNGPDASTSISVLGSHGTVTPTTLPMWLSATTIDDMTLFFGYQLRKELINLMVAQGWRKRVGSTGSGQEASDDGFNRPGEAVVRNREDMLQSHFLPANLAPQTLQL